MSSETTSTEDSIEGAYDRASSIFTLLFADREKYQFIETRLLENSIINFLDKLGQISPKDEKIVVFPLQSSNSEPINKNAVLIECLELSIDLVNNDPGVSNAINNAIAFLNSTNEV